jgi:hypothetical protein
MSNPRRAPIDQVSFVNRRRSEGVSWAAIVDELATRGMRTSSRGLRRLIASLGGEEPRGTASGRRDVADRPLDASERRADPSASTPRYESHGQHVGADLSERAILTEQIVLLGGDLARKIPPADRARDRRFEAARATLDPAARARFDAIYQRAPIALAPEQEEPNASAV